MSTVVFTCGPAGSGKTTVALRLEATGFARLSVDEEAWREGFRLHPLPEDVATRVRASLRQQLLDLVAAGRDVVLDLAFWSREVRDDYRRLLAPLGVVPETYYLSTPRDVVLSRMRARDGAGPNAITLPPGVAESYYDAFEVPTPAEGPMRIIAAPARELATPEASGAGGG